MKLSCIPVVLALTVGCVSHAWNDDSEPGTRDVVSSSFGDPADSDDPVDIDDLDDGDDPVDVVEPALAAGVPVNLGTAGDFVILAKSGISTVPQSAITGDIGVSPIDVTAITGFSLIEDATGTFSTASQVDGAVFAADDASPTPSRLTTAVLDMEAAFVEAAGRAPGVTELGAGNIGGLTLDPGVYAWGPGVLVPTDLTLDGSATDVWIFQIAQNLTLASGVRVELTGGAVPDNVFWQVSGLVDIGTTAHLEGIVLTATAATLKTGSSIDGRLLAQTAVTLDGSTVVEPAR